MSTPFYDLASLVVVPSGYKSGKVYAQKPLTTDGQLAFTRASSATRVASNGLIEKVRTNVLTYSQDFSNANWVGFDVSRTGTQTDPNGGTTASLYTSLTNSANVSANFSTASASPYTLSIYIRGASSGVVSLRVDSGSTAAQNNISYTTSWQRFTYTFTAGSSTSTVVLGGYASFTTGEAIYVAFAQAELGDIATDYIATTSAAVSVGPVSGLPRLDYLNSTCPRLLLEPQRTNSVTYSEQVDNAAWSKLFLGVTANNANSPDGFTNADKLIPDATLNTHLFYQSLSPAAGVYTQSAFFKAGEYNFACLRLSTDSDTKRFAVVLNLTTGAITATDSLGSPTSTSSKVENYGNGWYRLSISSAHTSGTMFPTFAVSPTAVPTFSNSLPSFTGDGTSGIYIWGAQLEAGAYATSYIPTLGASVTRVADAASKTGISSLIGQTEGTLFVDFTLNGRADYGTPISVNDGTTGNYVWLTIFANGTLRAELYNGAAQATIGFAGALVGSRYKMAFGYKTNDFAFYVNGALAGTDLTGTTFSGTTLSRVDTDLTNASAYSLASESINQALLFKTRLTNAQLAELTAL